MKKIVILFTWCALLLSCVQEQKQTPQMAATTDNGEWFFLQKEDLAAGTHHTRHAEIFGTYVDGYNDLVLRGIDKVQQSAMDGGGYFIGLKADPPESPVGYPLQLFGKPLLEPPRSTSYCSGATYSAFVEMLNMLYGDSLQELSADRLEALRMQEPDGGRREDEIKFWGKWNDDGFGNHFALVQYSQMGTTIKPIHARPGDFMNISWKKGGGHSVVFLGWYIDENGGKNVVYWSSQTGTNGFGDQVVPIERIKSVKIVRLTDPDALYRFDIATQVDDSIPGDEIEL
ncbi:MAG: hypothetical protein H6695_06165 [Deferribacteres bacterium]|nr:hypothetical protein [candidate division KSB1 bacterium]MCB9509747.1 hypothetical protein [Deferribacteres bacterium]